MKRILVAILCFALVGVTGAFAATTPISTITNASFAQILVDENGIGGPVWYTDKGWLNTDSQPFIKDGRLMVSFRWATEVFGGSAEWTSRADGTTDMVTLYAPPVKTVTITVPVTVTNTIYVTNTITVTVQVPTLLPTIKLVKSVPYLTVVPTATILFWGLAPVGNAGVIILVIAPRYEDQTALEPQVLYAPTDYNGYFVGSFTVPADARLGEWIVLARQDPWSSAEGFTVLAP